MIPTVVNDFSSFATANRILELDERLTTLVKKSNKQAFAIQQLAKYNLTLNMHIENLNKEIETLQRVNQTLINLGVSRDEKIYQANKQIKKLTGIQISLTKSVLQGFQQINNQSCVEDSEMEKLEKTFKNLKIN